MNQQQSNYIHLKVKHEHAQRQARREMAPHAYLLDSDAEDDLELYVALEMKADRCHQVGELRGCLLEAENALLQWARETMHERQPAYSKLIDFTFDATNRYLQHRATLLNMAARLAPEE